MKAQSIILIIFACFLLVLSCIDNNKKDQIAINNWGGRVCNPFDSFPLREDIKFKDGSTTLKNAEYYINSSYVARELNNKTFAPSNGKHNKVYGANMHNKSLPYLKMGLYRYWSDSNKHDVFYDNLLISNRL
ncbi:hypothetical protein ACFS5M_02385 [Lacinutrix iliipiscaria]|uniref:Lipoprotein n=1 Tax=Lacinutrix iliipiscaria TaxID=1230532 RepID=A0ABW5WJT9_9FLAO